MVKNWVRVETLGDSDPEVRTGYNGIVPLELSFDRGQHYTTSNVSFYYNSKPIRVRQIYPTFGPRTGGTKVTMVGDNFNLPMMTETHPLSHHIMGYDENGNVINNGLRLKMGYEYVPVTSATPENGIQFTTPNAQSLPPYYTNWRVYPMQVPVEITLNNQQFTSDAVTFTFFELPIVTSILPTRGPAYGGTVVSIYGSNFLNFGQSACRFGTDKPQQHSTFVKTGEVTVFNLTGAVNQTKAYETGYFVCTTPPSIRPLDDNPPAVIVDMSLNMESYEFTELAAFPFPMTLGVSTNILSYYRVPVVVSSLLPSTGPVMGGTIVTVNGLNFTDSKEITCRFGYYRSGWNYSPRIVTGQYVSGTQINCLSPRGNSSFSWYTQKWEDLLRVGTEFDLALNGQQYTNSRTRYNYSYATDKFYVDKLWPQFAPGLSRYRTHVNLTGVRFDNTGEITCKFMALFNSPSVQRKFLAETEATFFTTTSVTCWTPYFSEKEWRLLSTKTIAVDVSLNGQNYRSDDEPNFLYKTVTFYDANPPRNVTPSSGPFSGGTDVVIAFDYRIPNDYGDHPLCRWSYPDPAVPFDSNIVNMGTRAFHTQGYATKDSTKVRCSTPKDAAVVEILREQLMPLPVSLEVSFNGQNYEAKSVNFTFYSASEITAVEPSSGLTAADYKVTLTGNNFLGGDSYQVKFGDTLVRTVVLESPTQLVVEPPLNQELGAVHVFVSLNDQNWIDSCYRTFGATQDHVILHGTCDQFTWAPDPICYTCQTPTKPADIEASSSKLLLSWMQAVIVLLVCMVVARGEN